MNMPRTSPKALLTRTLVATLAAVLLTQSCKHEPPVAPIGLGGSGTGGTVWVPPPDTFNVVVCDPDTVYFQQSVLPLLVSFCATSGCHDAITHRDGVRLYDYAHIHQEVSPGHPNNSAVIESIQQTGGNHMPPSNHPQLTAAQFNAISTWIQQGALNNSCDPSACDTANVTYSGTIAPIFSTFCNGCHGGSTPSGGLNLTLFSAAQAVAFDGSLAGSIQHQSGYASMPPSGSGLSACRIAQVQDWIAQGAPNN